MTVEAAITHAYSGCPIVWPFGLTSTNAPRSTRAEAQAKQYQDNNGRCCIDSKFTVKAGTLA